jgi:inhibitor of KinA
VVGILCLDMLPLGDSGILVNLGDSVDLETHHKVRVFTEYLEKHPFEGMVECIPAFTSVTVFYDSVRLFLKQTKPTMQDADSPYDLVAKIIRSILGRLDESVLAEPRVIEIPVCYGGEFGVDLDHVASINGLTADNVINIHASGDYLVYMVGFAPGFPYLGGMSARIAAPRKQTPRLSIPAGTVGIAGEQTGVYPIETPGGWNLIGRTPRSLFLPKQRPPTLIEAGNIVRFYPITHKEYVRWKE